MSSNSERPRPKKKWGQNFLRHPGAVRRIAEALQPAPEELILEIGPGEGVLTDALAAYSNRLRLIEIDPELAVRLREKFGERVELIEGDATEVALPVEPFVAAGNLPYNVGNPIIRRIIAAGSFRRGVFMVQKEVADRLTAKRGDDAYSFLTLAVALEAKTTHLMTLEPGSFYPPPKVRSAVVVFEKHDPQLQNAPDTLLNLMSAAFRMRRKKLTNNLESGRVTKENAREALSKAGLSLDARADELTLHDYDRLATILGADAIATLAAQIE